MQCLQEKSFSHIWYCKSLSEELLRAKDSGEKKQVKVVSKAQVLMQFFKFPPSENVLRHLL